MDLESEKQSVNNWRSLSDEIIIKIFHFLPASSLLKVAQVCKTYHRLAFDEILWKDLFYRHWKIDRTKPMSPGKVSWVQEYKRLYFHTPAVESEVVQSHTDEVLYVSFAHNGKMFATCSKDGFIKVWDKNIYPCLLKHQADMSRWKWKDTSFSEFNESDTLLLVSGTLSETVPFAGEIAIFSLQRDFKILTRVNISPYDVHGAWYKNCFFSGSLNMIGDGISYSEIWLRKATKEMDEPLIKRLFRFRNKNYTHVRRLLIASVLKDSSNTLDKALTSIIRADGSHQYQVEGKQSILTVSMLDEKGRAIQDARESTDEITQICKETSDQKENKPNYSSSVDADATLKWELVTTEAEEKMTSLRILDTDALQMQPFGLSNDGQSLSNLTDQISKTRNIVHQKETNTDFRLERTFEHKADLSSLSSSFATHGATIYSVNSQSHTFHDENCPDLSTPYKVPRESNGHEVSVTPETSDTTDEQQPQPHLLYADDEGYKESCPTKPILSKHSANNAISIESNHSSNNLSHTYLIFVCGISHIGIKRFRTQEYIDTTTGQFLPDVPDIFPSPVVDAFDSIDHKFDMHSQILGMCLSPDHRYLYVNCRRWQEGYQIDNPNEPPPLAEEIDIHVLDLLQDRMVGKLDTSHKAYSPSGSPFLIYLDVCNDYVASGAEDTNGYIWDRHYGICLNIFPHSSIVNSVAFDPADPELLVTVSDDFSIKIWRSRNRDNNLIKINMLLEQYGNQETSLQEHIAEALV